MLARRIIPCLDIDKGRVVKGVNFLNLRDAGDAIKNAQFYERQGADELVFLDITASHECRKTTIDLVKKVAEVVFMPFTVGGGIRNAEDIRKILLAGADKVSLNTAAIKNPRIIFQASRIFGSQCIVVAIDAKRKAASCKPQATSRLITKIKKILQPEACSVKPEKWEVFINGGRTPTGIDAIAWARNVERLGAGEILLTSMDYDGTKDGYDIALTRAITEAVKIPVIASGGAGHPKHFCEVFKKTNATAALAASIFHFREFSVKQIKEYLTKNRVQTRM